MDPIPEYDDYALLVWLNPDRTPENRARLLQTVSSPRTGLPLAYQRRILLMTLGKAVQGHATILTEQLLASTSEAPVVVPLHMAASHLGWTEYSFSDVIPTP